MPAWIGATNNTRCSYSQPAVGRSNRSTSPSALTSCMPGSQSSGGGLTADPWGLPSNNAEAPWSTR